jgi:hypothetical protein
MIVQVVHKENLLHPAQLRNEERLTYVGTKGVDGVL